MAGTVTYGLNLQAWCVFLTAAHAIPVHRCGASVTRPRVRQAGHSTAEPGADAGLCGAKGAALTQMQANPVAQTRNTINTATTANYIESSPDPISLHRSVQNNCSARR
jgi:hypothetical protein